LLDPRYPVEQEMIKIIKAVPGGERSALLKALILSGFADLKKDGSYEQPVIPAAHKNDNEISE